MNSKEILNLTKKGLLTWKKHWLFSKYTTHDYGLNLCIHRTMTDIVLYSEGVEIERHVSELSKLQRQKLAEKLANINQEVIE